MSTCDQTSSPRCSSAAGDNPRDFAILQLFLQTGIRVSELVNLRLDDVDLDGRTIRITGKGNKQREIVLEKKATQGANELYAIPPNANDVTCSLAIKEQASRLRR